MIRWTQLNTLLPAMQFSLAPWDYGDECAEICRRYADLHTEFAPRILVLAAEAAKTGVPIIRPLWWNSLDDEQTLLCDDEFMLGNDILAAPVLTPGARTQDIYLPAGAWHDYWGGQLFEGNQRLNNYPAPLEKLPLFERLR
jgi:alpha-glucosidase (family GH31 glycosyl hydrolase)